MIVREAHDRSARLRIVARDTWTGRRAAVAPSAAVLDVSALSGIVEYVPGDLTLTARGRNAFAPAEERSQRDVAAMLGKLRTDDQAKLIAAMQTIENLLAGNPEAKPTNLDLDERIGD